MASGRRALDVLAAGDVPGAVLALGGRRPPAARAPPAGEPCWPTSGPRRPEVAPLLDGLLGAAVAVDGGWTAAVDVALAHPDAVVVTRSGGRFGHRWLARVAPTRPAPPAPRSTRPAPGPTAATDAATTAEARPSRRRRLRSTQARAGGDATAASARDRRQRTLAAATAAAERAAADRDDTLAELDLVAEQGDDTAERLARDRERAAELAAELPLLDAEEAARRERAQAMAEARHRLDEQVREVAQRRTDLDKRRTALADRNTFLRRRLAEVEERLAGSVEARREAEERRVELDMAGSRPRPARRLRRRAPRVVEDRLADMQARRERETAAQRTLSAQLDGQRRRTGDGREVRSPRSASGCSASSSTRPRSACASSRRSSCAARSSTSSPRPRSTASPPELADGMTPTVRVRELERELRVMGPINPLALEEFEALSERHTFLDRAARRREGQPRASSARSSGPSTRRSSRCSPRRSPT